MFTSGLLDQYDSPTKTTTPTCPKSPPPISQPKSPSRYLSKLNMLSSLKGATPSSVRRAIQLQEQLSDFETCIQKSVEKNTEYLKDFAEWKATQRKKHQEIADDETARYCDVEHSLMLPPPCSLITSLQSIGEECDEIEEELEEKEDEIVEQRPKLHRINSNISMASAFSSMSTIEEEEENEEEDIEDVDIQCDGRGIFIQTESPFGSPDLSFVSRRSRALSWGSISSADTMCTNEASEEEETYILRTTTNLQLQPIEEEQ
ncbi:hypothetical protein HK098_003197 [Nowakowskiella sp. JEL0407]|nr:hypothetical protein HK098_003197 [Nowakowskiella sp. JEL0407]